MGWRFCGAREIPSWITQPDWRAGRWRKRCCHCPTCEALVNGDSHFALLSRRESLDKISKLRTSGERWLTHRISEQTGYARAMCAGIRLAGGTSLALCTYVGSRFGFVATVVDDAGVDRWSLKQKRKLPWGHCGLMTEASTACSGI